MWLCCCQAHSLVNKANYAIIDGTKYDKIQELSVEDTSWSIEDTLVCALVEFLPILKKKKKKT